MSSQDHEAWEPLEGTPITLNTLAQLLGLNTTQWKFVDVLGLEEEILALTIPLETTCAALILLYPTTDPGIEAYWSRNPETVPIDKRDARCIFLNQIVGGSCGTLAVVHAIANSHVCHPAIDLDSPLFELIQREKRNLSLGNNNDIDLDSIPERSAWLVRSETVRQAHQGAVAKGLEQQTNGPSRAGQRQGRHFLTWVHRQGQMLELDGRRRAPTWRGMSSSAAFLRDAIANVREIFNATHDMSLHRKCSLVALVSAHSTPPMECKEA